MNTSNQLVLPDVRLGKMQMNELLQCFLGELPHDGPASFSDNPVQIDNVLLNDFSRLNKVLNKALTGIVTNFFEDVRIRNLYQLDEKMESLIRIANMMPFKPGMYRPDFLIDQNGELKLCEIGCRYPLNGWMLSLYLNSIVKVLKHGTEDKLSEVVGMDAFIDDVFGQLHPESELIMLHNKEQGSEIFYLFTELRKRGIKTRQIKPWELEKRDIRPNRFFILEMDREELYDFDKDILVSLIQNGNYMNDIRSLILIHDKRILAVLYDQNIMNDYLDPEEYEFLRSWLIPSHSLDDEDLREKLLNPAEEKWVLKANSGGRGIDVYMKQDCEKEKWEELLHHRWKEFMAQSYVEQKRFLVNQNGARILKIVGMLLCYNDTFYGPGLFRASSDNVINVHQGRGIILPSATFSTNGIEK